MDDSLLSMSQAHSHVVGEVVDQTKPTKDSGKFMTALIKLRQRREIEMRRNYLGK